MLKHKVNFAVILLSSIMLLKATPPNTTNCPLLSESNFSCVEILKGRDGPAGRDGRDGINGVPGPQGPRGFPGAIGATGAQGPRGHSGGDGHDGRDGTPGPRGPQGFPGTPGATGLQGPRGRNGRDGSPGARGHNGAAGPQGNPGAQGLQGVIGPQGPQGYPGTTGATGAQGPPGPRSAGVIYTRWGKVSCPQDVPGTELMYAGKAGGSHFAHSGGGANYLCMPDDPDYDIPYLDQADHARSYIYATEYELPLFPFRHDDNLPCAVCYASTRAAVMMIPAKTTCPQSWTREYYGYLMTDSRTHHRVMYECVDKDQESVPGTKGNVNGATIYHTQVSCSGFQCPPYQDTTELACVVCTK